MSEGNMSEYLLGDRPVTDSEEYSGTDDNDSQLICDLKDRIADLEEFANECIRMLMDAEPRFNYSLYLEARRLKLAKWLY